MTKEEAKKYLIDISYALGNMSIEYLTEKDGEKMREAIETLEQEPCEEQHEKTKDIDRKECKYHLGQIITMGKNKKEYEVVDISSEPWIEFDDGSMHYGMTIKPCDGSLKDAIFLNDAQID